MHSESDGAQIEEKHVSFLIGTTTKHLSGFLFSVFLPWLPPLKALYILYPEGSLHSAAGQTNSAFVIFEEIAGGIGGKVLVAGCQERVPRGRGQHLNTKEIPARC